MIILVIIVARREMTRVKRKQERNEKYTWRALVNFIVGLKGYSEDIKIDIVVDAYLDE